ncbi:MAG: PPC domain-containing protein [Limisphaerales bacterium]
MIRRLLGLATFATLAGVVTFAEKPTLEHIYPTAAARGETITLNLTGKFEPWPPRIWCSTAGLEFTFPTNKNSVQITVPKDARLGPCLIRLYNDEGGSDPAIFLISETPHLRDTEPNNDFAKPQLLTNFPLTINGRLDKNNDVDSFGFDVKAGQWLEARLESHTLMSKVDAVLRLVTTNGYQLAWNHDFASFDPRLIWQAPYDQTVVLQVFGFAYPAGSEIVLSGGNGGIYQLALSLGAEPPADLNVPLTEDAKLAGTNTPVFGAICPAGDEDKYSIQLKKDESIEVRVDAMKFGSDLDPWVKIEDSAGKELARNDDAEGSRDAVLEWKAPADGDYNVVVGSLTHRGEENWRYRLLAQTVAPDFQATIAENSFVLESTGTNELKVSTKRLRGFTNELSVSLAKLPEGLTAETVTVEAKVQEATLKLVTKDAPAFNDTIKILVKDNVTNEERPAIFSMVSRSENNGVPGGYTKLLVESTEDLWLTIKPPKEKPAPKPAEKAE